jgi:hypothetical protein
MDNMEELEEQTKNLALEINNLFLTKKISVPQALDAMLMVILSVFSSITEDKQERIDFINEFHKGMIETYIHTF